MTNTRDRKPGPIEVWLTAGTIQPTCRVVHEDETAREMSVDSPSMRGAQREITSFLIADGYTPLGRWETTAEDGQEAIETMRRFKTA